MSATSLRRAGLVMILVTIAARLMGYFREAVVAAAYGATREVDLFLAAFTIPAILIATVYYAIPNAFIPLWSDPSRPRGQVIRAALIVTGAGALLAVGTAVLAMPLSTLLVSGFSPTDQQRTADLLQIGSAAVVFCVIEALLRGRLLARKVFGWPNFSSAWQGMGVIVAVIGWPQSGAMGMMWGFVLGSAVSALWNAAILFVRSRQPAVAIETTPAVAPAAAVWVWIGVVILTDSLVQLYGVIDRHYGSYLDPGALAALNYASLVATFPSAIIGVALSTAIFPFLSEAMATGDAGRTRSILDRATSWSLIMAVPLTIWLAVYSGEVTAVLFQRGAFGDHARDLTSGALAGIAGGILPATLAAVWSRLLYAARLWRILLLTALVALVIKWIAAAFWVTPFGIVGLALATVAAQVSAGVMIAIAQRTFISDLAGQWLMLTLRLILLTGGPAIAAGLIGRLLSPEVSMLRLVLAAIGVLCGVLLPLLATGRWRIAPLSDLLAGWPSKGRPS